MKQLESCSHFAIENADLLKVFVSDKSHWKHPSLFPDKHPSTCNIYSSLLVSLHIIGAPSARRRIPAEAAPPVPLGGSENKYSEKRSPRTNGDNGWEKTQGKIEIFSLLVSRLPILQSSFHHHQNRDDVFTISLMLTRKMFFWPLPLPFFFTAIIFPRLSLWIRNWSEKCMLTSYNAFFLLFVFYWYLLSIPSKQGSFTFNHSNLNSKLDELWLSYSWHGFQCHCRICGRTFN